MLKQSEEITFKCGFCGEITTYKESENFNSEDFIKKNCCHTLTINRTGYGSVLEDHDIEIPCCDDCADKLDKAYIYK